MSNDGIVVRNYFVSGHVQGVGFRAFTRTLAIRLGLRGWVRNLPDGRVEAMVVGTDKELKSFEAELRYGPPHGSVSQIVSSTAASANFEGFEIRRDV